MEERKELANLIFPNINKTIEDYNNMYPNRNTEGSVTRFAPSPTGFVHIGNFQAALIDYIKSEVPRDQKVLESKLYDISSTHFGEAMIEFYEDMIIYHEKEMQRKEEEASIERIKIKLNSFKR